MAEKAEELPATAWTSIDVQSHHTSSLQQVAHLVVSQTGFALAALETFFNPVFRLGHTCELGQRRIARGVGEIVVGLPRSVLLGGPQHDQDFFRPDPPPIGLA